MRKTLGLVLAAAAVGIVGSSDASAKPAKAKVEMMAVRADHETVHTPSRLSSGDDSRGLYVRGQTAGRADFTTLLDRMHARGIDTVVLDAKDYDGLLTYPSKVAIANEGGAVPKNPPIKDLPAKIREIHAHGLRVAMRVSCFNDETMSKAKPLISVRSKGGHAYGMGWLDPSNPGAQDYVYSLVKESLDSGADEIELDYVRFPVLGIKNADSPVVSTSGEKSILIQTEELTTAENDEVVQTIEDTLGVGASNPALAIRRSAVIADGDKSVVYLASSGGKFEEKLVELGRVKGDYIEVVNGLKPGARVVIKGAFVLKSEKNKSELKGDE